MLVFWGRRDLLDISPTLTEAAGAIVDVKLLPFFLLYMHFYFSMEMIKIVFFFSISNIFNTTIYKIICACKRIRKRDLVGKFEYYDTSEFCSDCGFLGVHPEALF